MPTILIFLFATSPVADCARISLHRVQQQEELFKQVQVTSPNDGEDNKKSDIEDKVAKAIDDRAIGAAHGTAAFAVGTSNAALQSPAALFQAAVSQGSVFSPALYVTGGIPRGAVSQEHSTNLSNMISNVTYNNRLPIMRAACGSSAFSCQEIIHLANNSWPWLAPVIWKTTVMVFAEGRDHAGCISDPDNAKTIVDSFKRNWPEHVGSTRALRKLFMNSSHLKPAKDIQQPLVTLNTSLRTDAEMEKLLVDLEGLQLCKVHGNDSHVWPDQYQAGSSSVEEFETWLKQMRSLGEQFSGPQLVTLVDAIPKNLPGRAVSTLLLHLEQFVTGVTCAEVKKILPRLLPGILAGLDALKPNILDGGNKVDILELIDSIYPTQASITSENIVRTAEMLLRDVGVGLPLKNDPVFGVVKGNPVIFVVEDSSHMDAEIDFGHGTSTLRKFCYSQLERVLEGLPNDTYFNVIQYSSSALKLFQKPVLVKRGNIDAAMEAMGTIWRSSYTQGQDPVAMLRNIRVFALRLRHRLNHSRSRNSMEALRLAYATAERLDSQHDDGDTTPPIYHSASPLAVTGSPPQIYFLTSGQADSGTSQILNNIRAFDNGRNIPVNSIAFAMPADPVAKQFMKDLANKTGGFFRSIE